MEDRDHATGAHSHLPPAAPQAPVQDGIPRNRMWIGCVLLAVAAVGSGLALRLGVPIAEFVLAFSASMAVGALFFFLAGRFEQETARTRRAAHEVEERTQTAITSLRDEVTSLRDAVARGRTDRIDAAASAARDTAAGPTVGTLERLQQAAARAGLKHGPLRVWLRDRFVLSFRTVALEPGMDTGTAEPPARQLMLAVEQEPTEVADRSAEEPAERVATTLVPTDGDLAEAVTRLHAELVRKQSGWTSFGEDTERALRALAGTVERLVRVVEEAQQPSAIGTIEVVLDADHVLVRRGEQAVPAVVWLTDPLRVVNVADLAEPGDGSRATSTVLDHPLVARLLRHEQETRRRAERMREKKRKTQAISRSAPTRRTPKGPR